eukprot:1289797-Pyramimonas_sp.AAC.1
MLQARHNSETESLKGAHQSELLRAKQVTPTGQSQVAEEAVEKHRQQLRELSTAHASELESVNEAHMEAAMVLKAALKKAEAATAEAADAARAERMDAEKAHQRALEKQ